MNTYYMRNENWEPEEAQGDWHMHDKLYKTLEEAIAAPWCFEEDETITDTFMEGTNKNVYRITLAYLNEEGGQGDLVAYADIAQVSAG